MNCKARPAGSVDGRTDNGGAAHQFGYGVLPFGDGISWLGDVNLETCKKKFTSTAESDGPSSRLRASCYP